MQPSAVTGNTTQPSALVIWTYNGGSLECSDPGDMEILLEIIRPIPPTYSPTVPGETKRFKIQNRWHKMMRLYNRSGYIKSKVDSWWIGERIDITKYFNYVWRLTLFPPSIKELYHCPNWIEKRFAIRWLMQLIAKATECYIDVLGEKYGTSI